MRESKNLSRNTTMNTPVLDFNACTPFVIRESVSAGDANLVISQIEPADIAVVSGLTFPAFRPHLARCLSGEVRDGFESIAHVARHDGVPVGLLLVQSPTAGVADGGDAQRPKSAKLLSVSVLPAWRQLGVASRLMLSIEEKLRERDCVGLTADHTTLMPAWQPFERLLAACHWCAPDAKLLMSKGYCREVLKAPWLNALREVPPEFELFEWTQLSVEERIQLQHDVAEGMIPYVLSPFTEVEDIEPSISVGVRHHGEVVAWMIVTRSPLVPDALCYRSTFVRPHLRAAQALGPLILAAALRRHAASPIAATRPVGVYGMSFDSSIKMINFFRKRLAPYCFSTYESRGSMKMLAQTRPQRPRQ
jgi:predicted N-acetyltransferase YhbS